MKIVENIGKKVFSIIQKESYARHIIAYHNATMCLASLDMAKPPFCIESRKNLKVKISSQFT